MISCERITKNLGRKEVIKSFSYSFQSNESYSIIGANGVGKTTLLKILGGLLIPDSGKIERAGSFGWFAFRSISLMDRLIGLDQINIFKNSLSNSKKTDNRIKLWMQLEGFEDMLRTDLGHCSQGMKALLGLYISTLSNPDTLLWDEPFACLSPHNQEHISLNWKRLTEAECLIMTHHGNQISGFNEVVL